MVFFTCNSCGQCVKKAQVEKHYLTECRNCEVLSCMDCGKDFVGDDYKHHTKCVSENEKYGGKDYRASVKPNKGEAKQLQWIESVQAASSTQSVSPRVRGLLNRLADYNNIPRKKAKFERFVQNSLKVWDASLIEQIWTVFSQAGNKQQTQPEQKAAETRTEKEKGLEENGLEDEGLSEGQSEKHPSGDVKEKKKKKHHGNKESKDAAKNEVEKEGRTDEGYDNKKVGQDDCEFSKKKKKKKDKEQCDGDPKDDLEYKEKKEKGTSDAERTSSSGVEQDEAGLSKKEKRKKKHHSEETEGLKNVDGKEGEVRCDSGSRLENNQCANRTKDAKKCSNKDSKRGQIRDESKTETVSERPSCKADGEGDTGLKKKTGKRNTGKVVDQIPDVKNRKRKRSDEKLSSSDANGDSGMDGLLSVDENKTKKTNKSKDTSTGLKKDGSGETLKKSEASDKSVEKGKDGLPCVSTKKKKRKTRHNDKSTDRENYSGETLEKNVKKRSSDEGTSSDLKDEKMEKRKKTKPSVSSDLGTDDSSGGKSSKEKKIKGKDENKNTKAGLVPSKTKKLKKRKLEGDGSETVKSDDGSVTKKKKKRKSVDV